MNAPRMSLTLKPEIALRLNSYAEKSFIPKVRIINLALDAFLSEREEDLLDAETAASAWAKFESGGSKGIDAKEARKKLGL